LAKETKGKGAEERWGPRGLELFAEVEALFPDEMVQQLERDDFRLDHILHF
jgi:hypothetical protein